jgi:hypothetical protein
MPVDAIDFCCPSCGGRADFQMIRDFERRRIVKNLLSKFGRLNLSRKLLIFLTAGTTFLLLMPAPASALFGIGDVVFDPTSYATLAKIWSSDATTLTKVVEEVTQLGKIYGNAVQTYNQAVAMAERISHANRLTWLTIGITAVNDATGNKFGETQKWAALMNGNPALALSAWSSATLPISNDSHAFLAQETLGTSANLSNLASVEASDGSSTKCLSEIAEYRSAAQSNSLAISRLQSADDDDGDGNNSEIEQLNLVNAAQAAALHEQQSQGALHACLVEQQILANTWQRNAATENINSYGTATVSRQTNATEYGNVQSTYYGYVPQ